MTMVVASPEMQQRARELAQSLPRSMVVSVLAAEFGRSPSVSTVSRWVRDPGREDRRDLDRVDVAPLRDAVQRSGVSLSELAEDLGMLRPNGTRRSGVGGDATRLARVLGLMPHLSGSGNRSTAKTISYDQAVAIVRVLGTRCAVDPVDVGV